MEVLFNNHIKFVLNLDTNTFIHIVSSLESGLKGLDAGISSQCASAIDNLAAFYFNNITSGDSPPSPASVNLARHIGECPNLFPQILKTLFEIMLFEDAGNQWSLSRPILSLIMTSEQMFSELRAHILASQVRAVLLEVPYYIRALQFFFWSGHHNLLGSFVLLLWYKLG
ncbi:ARM repeat superfamily protein [Zea mays]|uniref:ARM repeat superfamily protein n=1 Tax=Zea mays TaxID=4577 RepID=A0A1D6LUF9_MAIZE|nr:ARM repeat superfamily protein [Zea mays]